VEGAKEGKKKKLLGNIGTRRPADNVSLERRNAEASIESKKIKKVNRGPKPTSINP